VLGLDAGPIAATGDEIHGFRRTHVPAAHAERAGRGGDHPLRAGLYQDSSHAMRNFEFDTHLSYRRGERPHRRS
ncbi:MAG: hypothetical protein ACR2OD_01165, partial [Gaiellaceae bacterium]